MKVLNLKEMQQVSGAGFDLSVTLDLAGAGTVTDTGAVMTAFQNFMNDPTQGQAFIDALTTAGVAMNEITLHDMHFSNFTA